MSSVHTSLCCQETLIGNNGYPLETHEVATEDGYILQLHRIPHGRMGSCAHVNASKDRWCGGRGPVFVMTGLLADSACLVLDYPDQSLGFVLADNGYDVWLGNTRGNTFGKRHRSLDVRSRQFWNFTFHEHAIYDLPAQIDYVLSKTMQNQLLYIGLSQGTLSFFTMMSERPEYNHKVKAFAGLAPFHKLAHIEVPPLAVFGPYAESPLRLAQALGGYEMLPKDFQLMSLLRLLCGSVAKPVCTFLGDRLNNLGSRYINLTRTTVYLCHIPAGTSTKNVIHFGQLVGSKRPQKFDYGSSKNLEVYGQRKPPEYNLSRVTTDVGIFWSEGDQFVTPREVGELRAALGARVKREWYIGDPFFTHLHFFIGLASKKYLFKNLLDFLAGYPIEQEQLGEDVATTTNAVYPTPNS
ncbi:lysosomal acid lipase/cholesteryl ester hydrolase-like [Dermacentor andersoni]|uniref:lysosomal acid lipase/cholesteryl ester hydrolase-like n=1 Tax=Dermacentor andersoni TaxID=34620 RepID=UPI00241741F3|nr:lysosomal acid lipase/cholesteryl ester hydrolase-like [Dermacentor andersoni]